MRQQTDEQLKQTTDKQLQQDELYMKRAIELAKRGTGWVNPNPLVGAVIVKDDRIIGEGWHRKYGELHAERDALSRCMEDTRGATIYVTLQQNTLHRLYTRCTQPLYQLFLLNLLKFQVSSDFLKLQRLLSN